MTTMTRIRLLMAVATALMTIGLAACATAPDSAGTGDPDPPGGEAIAGMCAQEEPDCVDTVELLDDEPVTVDETAIEQFRRDAQFYLGASEGELTELIRVARIGDERFALTEDYVIGRITVELDDLDGGGAPVVTSATVELPDGPETFELEE
ncbi:MAG TPA: hypothetical protein VMM35_11330 [Longimicrobiales bacterium]|nr:hypothetical protein [Longimicrobiales bacterium]